jgi:transglutaminase-like putative cysteine protease
MTFRVRCELDYILNNPSTFLFALKCVETGGQKIHNESMVTTPGLNSEDFTIGVGMNRFTRLKTTGTGPLKVKYEADVQTSFELASVSSLNAEGPDHLIPEAIPFLFPSRYCQSDRLRQQAQDLFGHLQTPHALAAGISDWIYEHVGYVSGVSNEQSSAVDTLEQRQGVCRDFAHLAIAFCRAMNVPARYLTCYSHQLNPPDFHAVFEVYINGMWYVFDATRLAPLNGLVRIATGRDAADAAVCTIFGNPSLQSSVVSCDCQDRDFLPITRDSLAACDQAIALL